MPRIKLTDDAALKVQSKPRYMLPPDIARHRAMVGTCKIADAPKSCAHSQHNPPMHMVYEPGVWQHVCPGCGASQTFTVTGATI